MTNVIPIAITPTMADWRPTFRRLLGWKKAGTKTATSTTTPMKITMGSQFPRTFIDREFKAPLPAVDVLIGFLPLRGT